MTLQNRLIPWVCGLFTIGLLLAFMHRDYPSVGLDFGQFVPRLIDTDLFIRINGFVPQWYTPSFGSGLPAFANPQHTQYSLIQLLFLVMGPWSAVLWSTAIVSAIGFATGYLFFKQTLGLSIVTSTLGAMSLIANGFYLQHIAGGHVGFQMFPFIAVILFSAASNRFSRITAATIAGLAAAAVVFAAGPLIAVLIGASLIISFQVTHLCIPAAVNWGRLIKVAAMAAVVAASLTASKIYAVNAFMSLFPRELADRYDIGLGHALFGLGSQLAGGMMIIPILVAGGFPTQRLDDALVRATGSGVHVSELDVSIQPVLTIALMVAVIRCLWLAGRGQLRWRIDGSTAIALALLFATVWIAIETTLARGAFYPVLHKLPVLRSMHVNHRVAAVFILPITIAAAFTINAWRLHSRTAVGALLLSAALIFQSAYFLLPEQFYRRWFDITKIEQVHARVRAGERFPVTRIDEVLEENVFADQASSRVPYEPLFGYDNERFKAEARNGPVDSITDGRFNLTNPASLVFPELNGLKPFERIHQEDADNFRRFVNRQQPHWRHPATLDWLNLLAVSTLAFCVAVLTHAGITSRRTAGS